jgi:hypothetical protein
MLDLKLLGEINCIISEIEAELNQLDVNARKHLANTVYILGNDYLKAHTITQKVNKYYAFVICKSSWFTGNKLTLKLKSSLDVTENPDEISKVKYKTDDYRLYKDITALDIFDIESLVKIKRFVLSFTDVED